MSSRLAVSPRAGAVLLSAWLVACGTDTLPVAPAPADPGYRSLHVQDEASLGVTATGMLAGIGCAPVQGRPDSTAVAIPLLPGTIKFYRCPGVRTATLLATAKAIRAVTARNPVWASALTGGAGGSPYYGYDHTECVWQESRPPEYGQRINADGDFEVFVVVDAQPGTCAWMAIFKYKVPGDDGTGATPGSWGPGTSPATTPMTPTTATGEPIIGPLLVGDEVLGLHDAVPDCARPQRDLGNQWFCSGRAPGKTELGRINAAVSRMRAIGGICAVLADTLSSLIARRDGSFRLHAGSAAGTGFTDWSVTPPSSWMTIRQDMVNNFYDAEHATVLQDKNNPSGPTLRVTLQLILAHEAEHLLPGTTHLGSTAPQKWLLPNTMRCSDLPTEG